MCVYVCVCVCVCVFVCVRACEREREKRERERERERFAYVTVFYNSTIEVVTFCLRGCCMLGVFLLPAFIRLGRVCQDLLSPSDGMYTCTD